MTRLALVGSLVLLGGCAGGVHSMKIACEAKGAHWFLVDTNGATSDARVLRCAHADSITLVPFKP